MLFLSEIFSLSLLYFLLKYVVFSVFWLILLCLLTTIDSAFSVLLVLCFLTEIYFIFAVLFPHFIYSLKNYLFLYSLWICFSMFSLPLFCMFSEILFLIYSILVLFFSVVSVHYNECCLCIVSSLCLYVSVQYYIYNMSCRIGFLKYFCPCLIATIFSQESHEMLIRTF